jgi:hypothetical protein
MRGINLYTSAYQPPSLPQSSIRIVYELPSTFKFLVFWRRLSLCTLGKLNTGYAEHHSGKSSTLAAKERSECRNLRKELGLLAPPPDDKLHTES